ncbi:MAG TPA: DinB family protein [Pirellulales bacterium]|jgi:hypothetical protein|nr:DinB family protein [Pirellulales bacterium]
MLPEVQVAVGEIKAAREYTLRLLETIDPGSWFRRPDEVVTHVAWQAGHLAMAQYRLGLERIRGHRPEDDELISPEFLAHYGKSSAPEPDPAKNPQPDEIMLVLSRVYFQTLREAPELPDDQWHTAALKPHPLFTTKLGSLLWCARHEMLHAGQIGLLRRLHGHEPLW